MRMFDKIEDSCFPEEYVLFSWTKKGVGFGQLAFYEEDGVLKCDNECMSKERVKEILCSMVDAAEFTDV